MAMTANDYRALAAKGLITPEAAEQAIHELDAKRAQRAEQEAVLNRVMVEHADAVDALVASITESVPITVGDAKDNRTPWSGWSARTVSGGYSVKVTITKR